ncbi:MAG: SIR2 family protein [Candidatus Desulfofervidaceae bacterium]|nr:SIR2 family protein [Candidatus Desulfofervidaceae bacterium]
MSFEINLWKEVLEKKAFDNNYLKNLENEIEKSLSFRLISRKQQLEKLIEAYQNEQLVLVLGAGVSVEYGLPNWDALLQNLLLTSFKTETQQPPEKSLILAKLFTKLFSPNPLIAARYLRNYYKQNKNTSVKKFEQAIRDTLYKHLNEKKKSNILSEIIQLCVAPGKSPNLDSIITFNYDDILESHLSQLNIEIPFKTISKVGQRPKPGELPIYHVHGFLPRDGDISEDIQITLSEDIYHQQYNNIYSWNNIIQLNKYRDNVCLFIGISLSDPNLRRLLDIAKVQRGNDDPIHFIIRKKYNSSLLENNLSQILDQNPDLLDEKSKANLKLDESVKYLVRVMEKFETQDDLSFGINTIWVNDYEEIPSILKSIRKREPIIGKNKHS